MGETAAMSAQEISKAAPAGSEKWNRLISLACAAKQLCEWTRHHEYPQPMSAEFMKLTEMLDELDTEVRRVFK
jgi:hypothetical protein